LPRRNGKEITMYVPKKTSRAVKGTIEAKHCKCCGHYEIGIKTDKGEFITLKLGTIIYCVLKDDEKTKEKPN